MAPPGTPPDAFLGVWTWDVRTGIVVACNDVCEYVNIPGDTGIHGVALGRFMDAVHPDDRPDLDQRISELLEGSDSLVADYRVRSVRHGTCWVRSSGHCFRDVSGKPTHVSGYLSRINDAAPMDEQTIYATVVEHLIEAREASLKLQGPTMAKLITAVMLEASYQLASLLRGK